MGSAKNDSLMKTMAQECVCVCIFYDICAFKTKINAGLQLCSSPTCWLNCVLVCDISVLETSSSRKQWRSVQKPEPADRCSLAGDYLSLLGLSGGDSSAQALPSILFLASAYSASRWARDLICGEGLFWLRGDPSEPLLTGRFRMRIWGGGAAGRESSCITMVVLVGDRRELLLDTLKENSLVGCFWSSVSLSGKMCCRHRQTTVPDNMQPVKLFILTC